MPCDARTLAEVELFEHLNDDDRANLAGVIDLRRLAAGDTLFQVGEPGESLYVVRSGEVELFIKDTAGQRIPLGQLADVKSEEGASKIMRDKNSRRIALKCSISGRDMGSFVAEAQRRVRDEVESKLPTGYHITWEGQFENQERANARLKIIVPISLLLVLSLLFFAFQRLRYALLILANVPFVLIGLLIVYRHPSVAAPLPAYEESVHIVADASGTHLEAAAPQDAASDKPPGVS